MLCNNIDLVSGHPDREGRAFALTFGQSETQSTWVDGRSLTWRELCEELSDHQEGVKCGPCFLPATLRGNRRIQAEVEEISLAVLDSDCGYTLDEISAAVKNSGFAAIIHSTHSHMTTMLWVNRKAFEKFSKKYPDNTEEQYLLQKGYLAHVAANAKVLETTDSEVVIEHNPCPKYRIIIPLLHPWRAIDYSGQRAANAAWKMFIGDLARELGIQHDQSCTDTSRLFFLARHAPGASFESHIVEGVECDIHALAGAELIVDPELEIFAAPGPALSVTVRDQKTGEEYDLTRWAARYANQFRLVDAIRSRVSGIFTGYVLDGTKYHLRCVTADRHTDTATDNATFVMNAGDSMNGGFVYHCCHDHCVGQDRLSFLKGMIEQGWLAIADLTDPQFLSSSKIEEKPSFDNCMAAAEKFTSDSLPREINDVLAVVLQADLDRLSQRKVFECIKRYSGMPLGDLKDALKEISSKENGLSEDIGYKIANLTLLEFYDGGNHLLRNVDGCFWHYNGIHWQRLTDDQLLHQIIDVVETHVEPGGVSYRGVAEAAFKLLTGMRALPGDPLRLTEEPPAVINCRNGELWIDGDGFVELRPHRYDSYLTYALAVDYDPTATCFRFDQALLDIFANASDPVDMVRHFMEFFGYAIQPRRDIASYFLLKGQGNNGKTKLIETLERLVSKGSIYSDRLANIESDRFAIGALVGKLILLDDDVDYNTKLPDGFLKKVSERKLMTGQQKHKDHFEFITTCLPIMLTYNYPRCSDLSLGMRRRAKLIPFDRSFTDQDKDDRLFPLIWANEISGVLNRAIEGLQRLRNRGDFVEPADCIIQKSKWLSQANPLAGFIDECCQPNLSARILTNHFYSSFQNWAAEVGIRSIPPRNTIKAQLEGLGYRVNRTKAGTAVSGLELR